MMFLLLLVVATLFLAYSNGANDNFKGVATLYGSGVTSFRGALAWATISTFAGSLAAAVFAERLLRLFSGKGLVPDWLVGAPPFLLAVLLGAGLTVLLTAMRGIPISTTHALVGGIVGAGLIAAGNELNYTLLGQSFFLPLAAGPLIAIALVGGVYPLVRWLVLLPIEADWIDTRPPAPAMGRAVSWGRHLRAHFHGLAPEDGVPPSVSAAAETMTRTTHSLHYLSAGAVGFARGLNDTPKIVAIALAAGGANATLTTLTIALAMGLGGVLQARRVGETMAKDITVLTPGRGTLANVVTSVLVIFASKLGLPVSTTHVSVGAIMGVGVAERNANWRLLTGIASAWVLTLPVSMGIAAAGYWGLTSFGYSAFGN